MVKLDRGVRAGELVPLGRDLQLRVGLDLRQEGEIDVAKTGDLHRAAFQRDQARVGVRNHLEVDLVQVRQVGTPVFVVALQQHEAAALPFLELERPGADRRLVGGVVAEIGALVYVRRHDGRGRHLKGIDEW
ncbi:hypothetical protein G6F65_020734 [Rhizopus arrhizus]|nr:hypothetical protein G6F65_020734 [Rhizopus arrhizus]